MLFTNIRLLDRTRYEPLVLLPSSGPIEPLLQSIGVRYVIWGREHEPHGMVRYAGDVRRAVSFFKKNCVQLLHINHANYWRPAEIVAARFLRIPIVTHYHVVIRDPGAIREAVEHDRRGLRVHR